MKQPRKILLLIAALHAAGCVTRHQTCYHGSDERTVFAIRALYDDTRVLAVTDGLQRYVLVPDAHVVASAEAMLLHYSQSEEPKVRSAAAYRLAHFGTAAALGRALEIAHAEGSPEIRAGIWSAIAELLETPLAWPLPQIKPIAGSPESNVDTDLVQLFSSPDMRLVINCWHKPADFILPEDIPLKTIESEIIDQYATDAGAWPVVVVDCIPFVPFSAHRRTLALTVRQSIADSLLWSAQDNRRIMAAFREFSRDREEAISGPARQVVEALGSSAGPDTEEPREDRAFP